MYKLFKETIEINFILQKKELLLHPLNGTMCHELPGWRNW